MVMWWGATGFLVLGGRVGGGRCVCVWGWCVVGGCLGRGVEVCGGVCEVCERGVCVKVCEVCVRCVAPEGWGECGGSA